MNRVEIDTGLQQVRRKRVPQPVNPARLGDARAELREVVGGWTTEGALTSKAQRLRRRLGATGLLVTRSEEGMTLFQAGRRVHVPAQAREVFDVSGAGDTVIATLAAMLAAGANLEQAVRVANRAAGIVVGKFGTAVVTPDELFGKA